MGEQTRRSVFEPAVVKRNSEGHVGRAGLDAQVREQGDQIGIGRIVETDKAGIHRDASGRGAGGHRIGVTAQSVRLVVERHPVALR